MLIAALKTKLICTFCVICCSEGSSFYSGSWRNLRYV